MLTYLYIFFFNDTATTEIYTLSLHDALPICFPNRSDARTVHTSNHSLLSPVERLLASCSGTHLIRLRSEEHTSELQSRLHLVCRLLLEKKKNGSYEQSMLRSFTANKKTHLSI